jgi:hypothetical protein
MNLSIIEHHPQKVLEAFRRGEFDQIEILGRADEKEFFELCFKEKILTALAKEMPTARKKEEVPLWFILAGNLSLKLHLKNSFLSFEEVIRCGGLLGALDPAIASKRLDPKSQEFILKCQGFNEKNSYERQTPCDQDTLRKALKDVPAQSWALWYNTAVQKVYQRYGFFDPQGVFLGDGSYLFVPDNPAYEGSVVMWFDEHNHPVNYEKLNAQERKRVRRRRCYKLISLLHLRKGSYVYAALEIVPGNAHEDPVLYRMVQQFVRTVGQGVMKLLILDRGFVDGERISYCKEQLGVDVLLPMKKKMNIWADAWALGGQAQWHPLVRTPLPVKPPLAHRPEHIGRRENKRQETLAKQKNQQPALDPAKVLRETQVCLIKGFNSWEEATVPIHVVLSREVYADGHEQQWGLMTTQEVTDPFSLRENYQRRVDIEERHRMLKCFYGLTKFPSRSLSAIVAQVVFILLSYTLRQWQLWKLFDEPPAGLSPKKIDRKLAIREQQVVIYHNLEYTQMPLLTFSRELLQLEPEARAKALVKVRELEQSLLSLLENIRSP